MARSAALILVVLLGLSVAHGRDLASYSDKQYAGVDSSSSAYAVSTKGSTVVKARAHSEAFSYLRNAASTSIAKAVAAVFKGKSVEAEAHAIAVATAEAVAKAYASSYALVSVKGHGYGKANAQSQAEAFAEAVAEAFASAFALATNYKYQSVAQATARAISKGVVHALVHTKISIKAGNNGYAEAAKREYVHAMTRVVAAAFADALAEVKILGPYAVATKSDSSAIANSFVHDLSSMHSAGYSVNNGNARVVAKSGSHKIAVQVKPYEPFNAYPW